MYEFFAIIILGIIISVLGIINMTGNISSVHSYHRSRITEKNKKPFARLIGLGTLLIGICLTVFGCFDLVYERTQLLLFMIIGIIILILGIVAGLIMSFYAMLKYNKGIF